MGRYFVNLSVVDCLEDCIDLSSVTFLTGGLDDGGDGLLG